MGRVAQGRRKAQGPRGDAARVEAAHLLAENLTVSEVARRIGVDRKTIQRWRDHPVMAAALPAAREERAAFVGDAVEEARRILRDAAPRAARAVVEALDAPKEADSLRAAATLLDRVGVPRTERVETAEAEEEDLSALTNEEFEKLREIRAKLRDAREGKAHTSGTAGVVGSASSGATGGTGGA